LFPPTFRYTFRAGNILLHSRNPNKVVIPRFDGITGEKLFVLKARNNEVLREDFLAFVLMSPRFGNWVSQWMSGSVNKFLNWSAFERFEFDLPPLDQQRRIAEILWAVEEVAEAAWTSREAILTLRKSAHREVFVSGLKKGGPVTTVFGLPAGWEETTVGAACVIENRLRKPINAAERAKIQGEYPYYGPTGVLDHLNEYRVEGEYVLIGEDGDHFLKFDSWDMTQLAKGRFNVNNHAHLLRGTEKCRTEWIYQYFKHRDIMPFLSKQGSGRLKMQKAVLEKVPFVVPPLQDQDEILEFLRGVDSSFARVNEHSEQTKRLLASLTNTLFELS
jgi:type I restriction enzyme S subunit